MAQTRRLITDQDFHEAQDKQIKIRIFKDDLIVETGVNVVRFNDKTVVVQSGVSDLNYHERALCEFFEMKNQ